MSADKRDIAGIRRTLLSFGFIVVALPVVTKLLVEAYATRQLVLHTAVAIVVSTPSWVTIWSLAMLFTGGFVGLLVVFALDEYKRVQRLLLATAIPLFVGTLWLLGSWSEVDLLENLWAVGIGIVVGAVVGLSGGQLPKNQGRRTFPRAARGLYVFVCSVVLVGFVERHLRYQSPILVEPLSLDGSVSVRSILPTGVVVDAWTVPYLVAGVGLIVVVNLFVNYANRRDVAILTPPIDSDILAVQFLGDLYRTAKQRDYYDEVKTTGDRGGVITEAGSLDPENVPNAEAIRSGVGFQFVPKGWLMQRKEVLYTGLKVPRPDRLDELERRASSWNGSTRLRRLTRVVREGLPFVPGSKSSPATNKRTDRIDAAETVLLLTPASDAFRTGDGGQPIQQREASTTVGNEAVAAATPREYIEQYARIYEAYATDPDHDVVYVCTEADTAAAAFEQTNGYPPVGAEEEFVEFVGERLSADIDRRDLFAYDSQWERDDIDAELRKILDRL